jgi:hypothetical protein
MIRLPGNLEPTWHREAEAIAIRHHRAGTALDAIEPEPTDRS